MGGINNKESNHVYEHKRPGKNNYYIDIENNGIYWRGMKIPEIDSLSFTDNGNGYGHDNKNSYYKGRVIGKSQGFINLSKGYAKNSKHIFFQGYKIIGADIKSFNVSSSGVAKDKKYIYVNGIIEKRRKPKIKPNDQ